MVATYFWYTKDSTVMSTESELNAAKTGAIHSFDSCYIRYKNNVTESWVYIDKVGKSYQLMTNQFLPDDIRVLALLV